MRLIDLFETRTDESLKDFSYDMVMTVMDMFGIERDLAIEVVDRVQDYDAVALAQTLERGDRRGFAQLYTDAKAALGESYVTEAGIKRTTPIEVGAMNMGMSRKDARELKKDIEEHFGERINMEWTSMDEYVVIYPKEDAKKATAHRILKFVEEHIGWDAYFQGYEWVNNESVEEDIDAPFKHRPGDYNSERFKHDRIQSHIEEWDVNDLGTWIERNIEPLGDGEDIVDWNVRNNQDVDLAQAIISKYEKLTDGWWSDVFENLEEGMAWGRSGNKVVKKFRCTGGPRNGRVVSKPAQCFAPPDIKKRMTLKRTKAKMGKKMARKRKKTMRTNAASKRVQALNKSKRK